MTDDESGTSQATEPERASPAAEKDSHSAEPSSTRPEDLEGARPQPAPPVLPPEVDAEASGTVCLPRPAAPVAENQITRPAPDCSATPQSSGSARHLKKSKK